MSRRNRNPLILLEASTGIEPVYTDLQSVASPLRQLASALKTWVFVVGGVIGRFLCKRKSLPQTASTLLPSPLHGPL